MIDPKPTMNEETDTPETLADIIAEMRRFAAFAAGRSRITPAPSLAAEQECHAAKLTKYADRIETAYKREHAEWHGETNAAKEERNRIACKMRYEFAAKCRACKAAPGNAAAMREAIVNVASFAANAIDYDGPERDVDAYRWLGRIAQTASAALAAPARNCDVGTAEEQIKRFETFCNKSFDCGVLHGNCGACPLWTSGTMGHDCEIKWSQLPFAPAEGGAE